MRLPTQVTVGTMNFGARTPAAEAERIVHRALERGASFFDTANVYGDGESERILGKALAGRRDQAAIATKVGLLKREGLGRGRIVAALEESLKRLRTEVVDLYYLHVPDPGTPLEETLDGIQVVLDRGLTRAWGVSNFASWQILELQQACDRRGMPRPAVSQVLYNLLVRQLEVEYFAFAARHPIHTTVYNPLAGGLLAHRPSAEGPLPEGSRLATNAMYRRRYGATALRELTLELDSLARAAGMELITLAYGWTAQTRGVDSLLAGPATVAQLDVALDSVAVPVPPELRAKVDEVHRAYLGTDARYAR